MHGDIDIAGAVIPPMMVAFCAALVLFGVIDAILASSGVYRHLWHPPLCRVAVFGLLFSFLGLLVL